MSKTWTSEDVRKLSNSELRNLLDNAEKLQNLEVQDVCAKEIERRPGLSRRKSPSNLQNAAQEVVDSFQKLGIKANSLFDLSYSTAKNLSKDVKGFRAHKFVTRGGKPKTGGKKISGELEFDYYVSYRLRDKAVALASYLPLNGNVGDISYTIKISESLICSVDGYSAAQDLSEYIEGTVYRFGKKFLSFEAAEQEFLRLLDTFAPRKMPSTV